MRPREPRRSLHRSRANTVHGEALAGPPGRAGTVVQRQRRDAREAAVTDVSDPPIAAVPPLAAVAAPSRFRRGVLPVAPPSLQSPKWLLRYLFIEIGCQVALLLPTFAGSRIVIRTLAFSASLLLALSLPGPRE